MKILVATEKPFAPIAVGQIKDIVETSGFEFVLLEKYTEKQQLLDAVSDASALIIRSDKITKEVIEAGKELKIVVRAGAGYDNVDLEAATANNVVVMNTPGQNANAVAELAMGMLLFQVRGQYNGKAGTEIMGKNIGIHAYGNIGSRIAEIAAGFKMNCFAFDPFISAEVKAAAKNVTFVDSVEELYSKCEVISLHIPANDHTKNSINFELLSTMPANAILLNTARKEVVCEEGLVKLMESRNDFSYISDIAPSNRELLEEKFNNKVFFTPKKMGAQTLEANVNAGLAAARQISGFLKEGDTTFKVN